MVDNSQDVGGMQHIGPEGKAQVARSSTCIRVALILWVSDTRNRDDLGAGSIWGCPSRENTSKLGTSQDKTEKEIINDMATTQSASIENGGLNEIALLSPYICILVLSC